MKSSKEMVLNVYPDAYEDGFGRIWSSYLSSLGRHECLGRDWDDAAAQLGATPEPSSPAGASQDCDVCHQPLVFMHGARVSECRHSIRLDAASRLTETKLPSSPAGEMGSEPVRKVLTGADIEKINEGTHSCGWTTGAVKNPNPACGCMCGTVYAPDGRAILSHSGRHGMRCQHADERGNLLVPEPLGADISGPKGSGGAAPEAKCANCRDYEANIRGWIEQLGGNPDVQHISLELERLIDAVAPPAAPIAPAAAKCLAETAWLIEKGQLCLGYDRSCLAPAWVTFTDPTAIRFARMIDGFNFITILRSLAKHNAFDAVTVNEHQWPGSVAPIAPTAQDEHLLYLGMKAEVDALREYLGEPTCYPGTEWGRTLVDEVKARIARAERKEGEAK